MENSTAVIRKEKINTFHDKNKQKHQINSSQKKLYPDLTEASTQILMEKLKTMYGEKVRENIWYQSWNKMWTTRSQWNFKSLHSNNSGILTGL